MRLFLSVAWALTSVVMFSSLSVAQDAAAPAAAEEQTEPDAQQLIEQGWKLFLSFHHDKANLKKSAALLESALKKDPANYLAPLYLARVYLAIGDELDKTKDAKLARFNQGLEMAKKAKALKLTSETEYWIAANLGRIGQTRGVLNSLFMVPEMTRHLDAALKLNPNNALALATLAELEYELPWPKGSNDSALEFIRKARKADPRLTYAMIVEAKVLIALDMDDEARAALEAIVNFKNPRYYMDFYTGELQEAKALLKDLTE
jgi:tetratricopeptide (TPR) repeat protein